MRVVHDGPQLLINPASLVNGNVTFAVSIFGLFCVGLWRVHVLFMILLGGFFRKGHDSIDVVDVAADEEGDVLLELEGAVEGRERRQGLDWVEGGDA